VYVCGVCGSWVNTLPHIQTYLMASFCVCLRSMWFLSKCSATHTNSHQLHLKFMPKILHNKLSFLRLIGICSLAENLYSIDFIKISRFYRKIRQTLKRIWLSSSENWKKHVEALFFLSQKCLSIHNCDDDNMNLFPFFDLKPPKLLNTYLT